MINHLASLLEKFKNLKDPKEDRVRIASTLSRELKFEITEDKVSLSKGVLTLKVDNYLKSEIFMRKDVLISALNKEGVTLSDIR